MPACGRLICTVHCKLTKLLHYCLNANAGVPNLLKSAELPGLRHSCSTCQQSRAQLLQQTTQTYVITELFFALVLQMAYKLQRLQKQQP